MKLLLIIISYLMLRRSREGAWIEIKMRLMLGVTLERRSREGAWIEIHVTLRGERYVRVAPARERGLKYICPCDYT